MANPLKYSSDNILDDGLNHCITNASNIVICEGMPANYSDATTQKGSGGVQLAQDTVTISGPSDGDTSGRKLTVDAVTDISIDVTGVMDFQAIIDSANSELLLVSPMENEEIIDVDTSNDVITISGDKSAEISIDDDISIRESTGNNGLYTVSSITINGSDNTEISLNETIDDTTVDGYCIYGAVKLNDTSTVNTGSWDQEILDPNGV